MHEVAADQLAQPKPLPGAPCNGCGGCCLATRCILAIGVFGEGPGPCPGLERAGARYQCGLLVNPALYNGQARLHAPEATDAEFAEFSHATGLAIAAGTGCDSRREGDPPFPEDHSDAKAAWARENGEATIRAFALWLGPRTREVLLKCLFRPRTGGKVRLRKAGT